MDANTTRGLVNQILFDIDLVADLHDAEVLDRYADSLVHQRHFAHPVEQYAEAIDSTLREGRLPAQTMAATSRHTEADLLDFLARLARRLDDHRSRTRQGEAAG
jgi:hypothetical protein